MRVAQKPLDDKVEQLFSSPQTAEVRRARAWLSDRFKKAEKLPENDFIFEVVEVTPVLAEVMLERNRGNRPPKPRRFAYARMMEAGNWRLTTKTISFSIDGVLNDGQNRLLAVTIAARSAPMVVAFGESRDVFAVIDTGAPRGGSDSLHIAGYKNTAMLAASARLLKIVQSRSPRSNATFTNEELLDVVEDNPNLEAATSYGGKIGKKLKGVTAAAPTVAAYLIGENSRSAHRVDRFMQLLADGNVPDKKDPVLVLREALLNGRIKPKRGGGSAVEVCAAIINAWNLWARGKRASVAKLDWPSHAPFPMPE